MKKKLATITAVWVAAFAATFSRSLAQEEAPAPPSLEPTPSEPALPTETAPSEPVADPTSPLADPREGKTITSIDVRFQGPAAIDKNRILANMSLKEGEKYSSDKEEADIKALVATGDVENVTIDAQESGSGVKIVVVVEARAGLGEITFLGNSAIKSSELRNEVDLETGGSIDGAKLAAAQRAIEQLYKEKGYSDVTVRYSTEPAANGFSRVVFRIDEGQRGYLREVIFEGNNSVDAAKLKKTMKSDNRGFVFWRGPKLDQDQLESDVKAIESYYQDQGFVNAKVTSYEKVRVDDKTVDLVIKISEGQQYTVRSVSISGAKTYGQDDLLPAFNLESGVLFSGSGMKEDIDTIRKYYASRGHANVRVQPQISNAGPGEINVVYAIEEGGKFFIDKVNITGNNDTKDEVIRREVAILPGDEFNQTKIDVTERRLRGLNYFKDITILPSDSSTPGYKDIEISVVEGQTGQLNFGAGFTSIDSLVGFVSIRESNFGFGWPPKGNGQRLNIDIKAGTKRKGAIIGWYEPWLFGNPLGFGLNAFYEEKTYLSDVYDQTQVGGEAYFRKKIDENSDLRLGLLVEQVSIENVDEDASETIKKEEGDYFHPELTLGYNYDSRDDIVLPREGFKFAAETSFSFGDAEDYGFAVNFAKPVLLPYDLIFTVTGSFETVDGDVPIFERLFLGGANTLRGFEYRDVGPKDEKGEPIGGGSAWWASAEITAPVVERVRVAAFFDIGAVDKDSWSLGGDINSDYGIGLRLNLPMLGPLKIDYAWPLSSDEFNDNSGRFNISVDYKF